MWSTSSIVLTLMPLKLLETPHIDRLAREGMLFERPLVPNSICGPSRARPHCSKVCGLHGTVPAFPPVALGRA